VFTRPDGSPVESIRDTWAKACCATGLGAMHCLHCGEQGANQKLPPCPGCDRKLTTQEQSYRGLLFHDLRRTAARNLRRDGIPESLIMEIGGEKTPLYSADMRSPNAVRRPQPCASSSSTNVNWPRHGPRMGIVRA
jgi:hypothetical protein